MAKNRTMNRIIRGEDPRQTKARSAARSEQARGQQEEGGEVEVEALETEQLYTVVEESMKTIDAAMKELAKRSDAEDQTADTTRQTKQVTEVEA